MYLVKLDENNAVLSCHDSGSTAYYTLLDGSHMLSPRMVPVGHIYDPSTQVFNVPPRKRWVTKLAFWNRLTQLERITIDLASERPVQEAGETDTDFANRRSTAAALRDMRTQLDAASYMDLTRADTQQGVHALEAMGLLAQGRAVEILDGPLASHEYQLGA